jgi:hypothetical protein
VIALAANGIVLGVRLVFFVGPRGDHVLNLVIKLGRRRPKSSKVRRW